MNTVRIMDKNRSSIVQLEIHQYKDEITKQKNNPVCATLTTTEVAQLGAESMKRDNFCLAKEQYDV